jgi:uncharacterized protein (DUF697 family)
MATDAATNDSVGVDSEFLKLEERLAAGDGVIRNHSIGAAAVGLIPIPAVDFVGLTALQLNLLRLLAQIYEVPFSQELGKKSIAALLAGFTPMLLSAPLASAVKVVPVIGSTLGGLAMSAVAGASTYAIGKVFLQHFDSGGTFLNFNPNAVRAYYREQFEQGKQVVKSAAEKS